MNTTESEKKVNFTNTIYELSSFSFWFTHTTLLISVDPSQKGKKITTGITAKPLLLPLISNLEHTFNYF